MNKKILIFGVLAALILVTISFASAVTTNTQTTQKKESPLFGIRTRMAIGERLQNLRENIKAKFVGERLFSLSFQWLKNREYRTLLATEAGDKCTFHGYLTCWPMCSKESIKRNDVLARNQIESKGYTNVIYPSCRGAPWCTVHGCS